MCTLSEFQTVTNVAWALGKFDDCDKMNNKLFLTRVMGLLPISVYTIGQKIVHLLITRQRLFIHILTANLESPLMLMSVGCENRRFQKALAPTGKTYAERLNRVFEQNYPVSRAPHWKFCIPTLCVLTWAKSNLKSWIAKNADDFLIHVVLYHKHLYLLMSRNVV